MFRAIAALALISASVQALAAVTATPKAAEMLSSTAPWWEKVTVTIAGDGKPQSCRYETSLRPAGAKDCDVVGSQAALGKGSGVKSEFTRITFERRFTPGALAAGTDVQPGDMLLGRQVMALAIDSAGSVKGCKIVAASGDMTPDYGCKEAATEKFEASVDTAAASARQGLMTILVYGHAEHVV